MREKNIKKKYRSLRVKQLEMELRNILRRDFRPERKDKVWMMDIKYI